MRTTCSRFLILPLSLVLATLAVAGCNSGRGYQQAQPMTSTPQQPSYAPAPVMPAPQSAPAAPSGGGACGAGGKACGK